jgi:iron complex transport system ATP-binding protein
MIELRDVSARYPGSSHDVLKGVSCSTLPGRLTAIVGPNGSGKSTTVRLLLKSLAPSAGSLRLGALDVATASRMQIAQTLAVIPQREELAFPMRVADYIALARHPLRASWAPLRAADRASIDHAMVIADVGAFTHRTTDTLSGGEWQRVRIARALAQETPHLVVDEPSTFLDVAHEMACFELFAALADAGRTVILISHQLNLVARFAHHVVLLGQGSVVAQGPPEDVMRGDVLEQLYQWPIVVSRDPAVGTPTLIPLRQNKPSVRTL